MGTAENGDDVIFSILDAPLSFVTAMRADWDIVKAHLVLVWAAEVSLSKRSAVMVIPSERKKAMARP